MKARLSFRFAAVSLCTLLAGLLSPRPTAFSIAAAIPVAALLVAALRPPRRWGGWVAVCMIPYVCVAIGETVANPAARWNSTIVAISAVGAFFSAMDYVRRTGTSLKN